jgi:hypothetical protein
MASRVKTKLSKHIEIGLVKAELPQWHHGSADGTEKLQNHH